MADDGVVLALDVGGTTMRGALAQRDGTLIEIEERLTDADQGPESVLESVLGFGGVLAERVSELGLVARAAGVAVPGIVDEQAGVALSAVNLGWSDVPIVSLMSEQISLPVALAHDVRAAGAAEQHLGAARGYDDCVFVALGTGIAAAMVIGGEPYAGAHWRGGELGHIRIDPRGPPCACGGRGHLEAIASAGAIARLDAERTGRSGSAESVARRAAEGDAQASALWSEAVGALAEAIATYVALLDPELVVIGGGLAQAGELLFGPLPGELQSRLPFTSAPRVVPGALGADAGVLGAALRAWAHVEGGGSQ